jgi:uncharacterized protein YrrD
MNCQDAPKTSSLFCGHDIGTSNGVHSSHCMLRCVVINCLESKIIIIHVKYNNSIFDGKMTNRSSYTLPREMHHI